MWLANTPQALMETGRQGVLPGIRPRGEKATALARRRDAVMDSIRVSVRVKKTILLSEKYSLRSAFSAVKSFSPCPVKQLFQQHRLECRAMPF